MPFWRVRLLDFKEDVRNCSGNLFPWGFIEIYFEEMIELFRDMYVAF